MVRKGLSDRAGTGGALLPVLFIFDRSDRQVNSFIGKTSPAQLEAAIKKLLA